MRIKQGELLSGQRWGVILCVYGVSLYIVFIQLMWFYRSKATYLALIALHAASYIYMAFRSRSLHRHRLLCAVTLGGLVIGTMPYLQVAYAVEKLLSDGELSMTNLTRELPNSLRVIIELGFVPALQACLAWVVLRFGPRKPPSADPQS